jgi:beta-mannosidase
LRIALDISAVRVSEETVFLTPPRFLSLPKTRTRVTMKLLAQRRAAITFTSPVFQHRFAFDLRGLAHQSGDNYFELYPDESKIIEVELAQPATVTRLKAALTFRSLADTY